MSTTTRKEVDKAGEKVEFRQSTFRCAYCNSGAESFSAIFSEGSCVNCGGPAGVVVEISRPEDIKKLERAVMLVYSKADEALARQIMADNEQAGNKVNVLTFLVDTTRFTLVIPSKEMSNDRLVAVAVEAGMISRKNKIVPLYPDRSYQGRRISLDTISGVVWQERSTMRGMDKSRFIEYLKKEAV